MIQKYLYGVPFDTESVVTPIPASQGEPPVGTVKTSESGFCFACPLAEGDRIYGLGEANRGINKRGFVYVSDNVDDGLHTENKQRMYAAPQLHRDLRPAESGTLLRLSRPDSV